MMKKPKDTYNSVLHYFKGNTKALEIVRNKPFELYAEESADSIIEMIESEVENEP